MEETMFALFVLGALGVFHMSEVEAGERYVTGEPIVWSESAE